MLGASSGGGKRSADAIFASCEIWDGENGSGLPGQIQSGLRSLGLLTKKALMLHCCNFFGAIASCARPRSPPELVLSRTRAL